MMRPKPSFCFLVAACCSWLFLPVDFFFLAETLFVDEYRCLCRLL